MSSQTPSNQYDYVVVGGGPVGAVMALGLADQGYEVALIERAAPLTNAGSKQSTLGVDARTVALSVASRQLLDRYDAWPETGIGAFNCMEVWEDRGTSVLRFGAEDVNQDTLGHIAEVGPWRIQLWRQLAASRVRCIVGQSVTAVHEESRGGLPEELGGYRLELAALNESNADAETAIEERTLFASTLIAADGAGSIVRRELGVPMQLTDTGQSALAFAARIENTHEDTAFQRFLADGPLALLPMADPYLISVVWSAHNQRADELAALDTDQLGEALYRASEARLGRIEECIAAVRFPLRQGVISSFYPRRNVVFIGDAARVVHPLAGQGVNLGFEDVRALLECTAQVSGSNAYGLQRFARVRRARSRLAVGLMSALAGGYAGQSPGLLLARNSVTRSLGRFDFARRALVLEAMGLGPLAKAS